MRPLTIRLGPIRLVLILRLALRDSIFRDI